VSTPTSALLFALSTALLLPGCLELGGSWDPSATATSSATTTTTVTNSTTATSTATSATGTTTGSTTEGSSTSTAGTTETSGCAFLGCEKDTPADTFGCDIWEQDCPEGHKCMPWANDGGSSWNATKCSPVAPNPDPVGAPCTAVDSGVSGVDSCDAESMCFDVDPETLKGTCFGFCEGGYDDVMCPEGTHCSISGDGVLLICLPSCDPLAQDCPGDDLCLPVGRNWDCILDASGKEGQYGDPCEYANACDPGLICLNPEYVPDCEASECCSPFCDTSQPNTCPGAGQVCIPWYEEGAALPGYEHVGVCGILQ
jgi:hypothetical protein